MQKTNFKTRLLALLTAAFMIVMCVPFAAFAEGLSKADTTPIEVSFFDGFGKLIKTETLTKTTDSVEEPAATRVEYDTDEYEFRGDWANTFTNPVETNMVTSFDYNTLQFFATTDDKGVARVYLYPVLTEKKPVTTPIEVSFFDGFGKLIKTETLTKTTDSVEEPAATRVEYDTDNYEFHGDWANTFTNPVETNMVTSFDYNTLKFFATTDDEGVAHVYLYPVLTEKKPETKTVKFCFDIEDGEKGTFTGKEAGYASVMREYTVNGDTTKLAVPAVDDTKGNYTFKGWASENNEYVIDADSSEIDLFGRNFDDVADGTVIMLYAQFEKKATEPEQPETQKKFHVTFTVAPEKGSFNDYGEGPVTFEGHEDEVGDQQYDVPAVTAKEGYEFVGWKGQGADEIAWDADAKTFGVTGLCFYQNGSNDGYASIEAVFVPTVKLTDIKVNFLKEDGKTVVCNAQYFAKDATLVLPYDVEGVTGWKLANNLTTYDVKTKFTFADLAAFVGTNYTAKGTAELTFYAQYKQDVKTDSTSTSSSSSNTTATAASQQQVVEASSNTTTTAASQKQVVKAAAAPANTTKVLPKTGATNAAPLIGGSLAVVALLMGYGVYGLVLRKKD